MSHNDSRQKPRAAFTVGWICALSEELKASRAVLDEEFDDFPENDPDENPNDRNTYVPGRIGKHLVVMACLPKGSIGNDPAAVVGTTMAMSFKNLRVGLMVGIGAGVPSRSHDIRLGDVVVSTPIKNDGGVIQWDKGKELSNGTFEGRSHVAKPPYALLSAISKLESEDSELRTYLDKMFERRPRLIEEYERPAVTSDAPFDSQEQWGEPTPRTLRNGTLDLKPRIHYGLVASGNSVIDSKSRRDEICARFTTAPVLCFEMEAAGLMETLPCLIVRGICDFADGNKNDDWHKYAAAVAAAYAWWLLEVTRPAHVQGPPTHLGLQLFNAVSLTDRTFVGRQNELQQLQRLLIDDNERGIPSKIIVISGMGGLGKTQLMLRFATSDLCQYAFHSAIWLDGTSETTLKRSLVGLAKHIAGMTRPVQQLDDNDEFACVSMARSWLSHHKGWLLLIDNYDEPKLGNPSPGVSGYDVHEYLPYIRSGGSVLLTSRINIKTFDGEVYPGLPDEDEGVQILINYSGREVASADIHARNLVRRLERLPLALSTAGHYLNCTPEITFVDYIEMYNRQWDELKLYTESVDDYNKSHSYQKTLFTAWEVSYERIARIDDDRSPAASLLMFLGVFSPDELWSELFRPRSIDATNVLEPLLRSKITFIATMGRLIKHAFVIPRGTGDRTTYSIHKCVHDWVVARLSLHEMKLSFLETGIALISAAFIDGDGIHWRNDARLQPHAMQLTHLIRRWETEASGRFLVTLKEPLYRTARLLHKRSQISEALTMFRLSFDAYSSSSTGINTGTMANLMNTIGVFLSRLNSQHPRWHYAATVAKSMLEAALSIRKASHRRSHAKILTTLANLGFLHLVQQNYPEAEENLVEALAGLERLPYADRGDCLPVMTNLAKVREMSGDLSGAECLLIRSVEGYQKLKGPHHAWTLQAISELAVLRQLRQKYDEARIGYEQVAEGYEALYGLSEITTLHAFLILGELHQELFTLEKRPGNRDQAETVAKKICLGLQNCAIKDKLLRLRLKRFLGLFDQGLGSPLNTEQSRCQYSETNDNSPSVLEDDIYQELVALQNSLAIYSVKASRGVHFDSDAGSSAIRLGDNYGTVLSGSNSGVIVFSGTVNRHFDRVDFEGAPESQPETTN